MKKKPKKIKPRQADINDALKKIAEMGKGMREEMIDYANIGRNAVALARETLREKCVECGK